MNNRFTGLTFIFIGITRYIVGAIITTIIPIYSKEGYYHNVVEFGRPLLIFSVICWIIGAVSIIYYQTRAKKNNDNNEDKEGRA